MASWRRFWRSFSPSPDTSRQPKHGSSRKWLPTGRQHFILYFPAGISNSLSLNGSLCALVNALKEKGKEPCKLGKRSWKTRESKLIGRETLKINIWFVTSPMQKENFWKNFKFPLCLRNFRLIWKIVSIFCLMITN